MLRAARRGVCTAGRIPRGFNIVSVRQRTEGAAARGHDPLPMTTLLWIVIGCLAGWVAYGSFGLNEARGRNVSMVLGAAGALVGAKAIAPLFINAPVDGFHGGIMVFALAAALGALLLANLVANRWDV
jgi:uncharacterized membrane protein YeaQ/YmgE (transglycosylase-associated protein family)